MSDSFLIQALHNSQRARHILRVFAKYNLLADLKEIQDSQLKRLFKGEQGDDGIQHLSVEERIRMAFQELGTSFVKLGQMLSLRSDVVGEALANELKKLQQDNDTDDSKYIESTICNAFKVASISEVFKTFEMSPMASASVAQVHRAMLKDGQKVVVKIIHQGVEEQSIEDMQIMEWLSTLVERYVKRLAYHKPTLLVQEFKRTLLNEFDLGKEKKNLLKFQSQFENNVHVRFPKPISEYCDRSILTMEFIKGHSLNDFSSLHLDDQQKKGLASHGAQLYMDMIFKYNFYHADPHPGNIFVINSDKLGLIDCGMVGRVDKASMQIIENLIGGVLDADIEVVRDNIIELGELPESCDVEKLETDLEDFIDAYLHCPINELDISSMLQEGIDLVHTHRVFLPAKVSMLLRTLMLLEGSSRLLNPDFNLIEILSSYFAMKKLESLSPKQLGKRIYKKHRQWNQIIDTTPQMITTLMETIQNRDFKMQVDHKNLESLVHKMVLGITGAAIFMGSSFILSSRIAPLVGDFSLLGLLGMLFAFALWISMYFTKKQ